MAKDYAALLAVWSLRLGLVLLLILSFEWLWRELIEEQWMRQKSMLEITTLLLLAALGLAFHTKKLAPMVVLAGFYSGFLLAALVVEDVQYAIYFQVACNLVLIVAGMGLIFQAVRQGISHYFFLGVGTILLTALLRYVDLIGDYVGAAALFIVFAILLLAAAKYWKSYQLRTASS